MSDRHIRYLERACEVDPCWASFRALLLARQRAGVPLLEGLHNHPYPYRDSDRELFFKALITALRGSVIAATEEPHQVFRESAFWDFAGWFEGCKVELSIAGNFSLRVFFGQPVVRSGDPYAPYRWIRTEDLTKVALSSSKGYVQVVLGFDRNQIEMVAVYGLWTDLATARRACRSYIASYPIIDLQDGEDLLQRAVAWGLEQLPWQSGRYWLGYGNVPPWLEQWDDEH